MSSVLFGESFMSVLGKVWNIFGKYDAMFDCVLLCACAVRLTYRKWKGVRTVCWISLNYMVIRFIKKYWFSLKTFFFIPSKYFPTCSTRVKTTKTFLSSSWNERFLHILKGTWCVFQMKGTKMVFGKTIITRSVFLLLYHDISVNRGWVWEWATVKEWISSVFVFIVFWYWTRGNKSIICFVLFLISFSFVVYQIYLLTHTIIL